MYVRMYAYACMHMHVSTGMPLTLGKTGTLVSNDSPSSICSGYKYNTYSNIVFHN